MTGTDPGKRKAGRSHLRILTVHRYYWPDTAPYASLLRRIVQRWQQEGNEVEVLSSQPSYKATLDNAYQKSDQTVDGVRITRLKLANEAGKPIVRIRNAIRLGLNLVWRAVVRRYDVVMISTAPPVLGGLAAAIACRLTGARFIYHCMDIHPEVGRISGEFSHPAVFGLLRKLDNWSCHQAEPVVVLSRDMEQTLRERPGGDRLQIRVLNNFSLPDDSGEPEPLPFEMPPCRLNVLFAGNIGRFQGLETAIQAMARLTARGDIRLTLMGDGIAKEALQEQAQRAGANVQFLGHQPVAVAKEAMRHADAGFVSLVPGIYRYAYPSKTMTYLEQGCPLIVAVEPESELAREVEAGGYGYAVPPDDAQALASLFERLADDPSWKEPMRENASQKALDVFSEPVVLHQWSELLSNRTADTE
ncbi:glycosyltransferase family 4 protein [Halovibrio salipaludis]|nr:glycosyltransferase family 4 protein [Halovibrio salipaludis]